MQPICNDLDGMLQSTALNVVLNEFRSHGIPVKKRIHLTTTILLQAALVAKDFSYLLLLR